MSAGADLRSEIGLSKMEIDENGNDDNPTNSRSWNSAFFDCLNQVRGSGKFATSENFGDFVDPWIEFGGQRLALPLDPKDAEMIKRVFRPTPSTKGKMTLVDTSVRSTTEMDDWTGPIWVPDSRKNPSWELDSYQVKLANPGWEGFLRDTILPRVARQLDLWDVSAVLRKILLHGEGFFSEPRQGRGKIYGTLGTLVVCLPSEHSGGDFHLSSGDLEVVLRTSPGSKFDLTVLAWHTDVTHEIKPLVQGCRLVLTYDLDQLGATEPQRIAETELHITEDAEMIRRQLLRWPTGPTKIAYPLSHLYKGYWGLSLRDLTGRHRNVAVSLRRACALDGFIMCLANMTRTNKDVNGCRLEGTSTVADWVITCSGSSVVKEIELDDSEILGVQHFLEREPDGQDEGGFTGNASMSDTFHSNDTVIIIMRLEGLTSLIRCSATDRNIDKLVLLACKQIRGPSSRRTIPTILDFFQDALDAMSSGTAWIAPGLIASEAVKLGRDDIFMAAVTKGIALRSARESLLRELWRIADMHYYEPEGEEPFEWGKWFDGVVSASLSPREDLEYVAALIEDGDTMESFENYIPRALDKAFQDHPKFTLGDHDFVIDMVLHQYDSSGWIDDILLPTLKSRASRDFLYVFLETAAGERTEPEFAGVVTMFQYFLSQSSKMLMLPSTIHLANEMDKSGVALTQLKKEAQDLARTTWDRFTRFVEKGLELGLVEEFTRFIDASCDHFLKEEPIPSREQRNDERDSLEIYEDLLFYMIDLLGRYEMLTTPSLRKFAESMLLDYILPEPPTYPQRLPGWAHRPIICPEFHCKDCDSLNKFLQSETQQVGHFPLEKNRRFHLRNQLPPDLFKCSIEAHSSPHKLVVTKLGKEHEVLRSKEDEKFAQWEAKVGRFEGEYMREVLGDDAYGKYILMEELRRQRDRAMGAAGNKRARDDDDDDGDLERLVQRLRL